MQKNSGRDDSADAGGRSQQALTSGDGYLQFTAQETNKLRFCGLARNPAVPDYAGIDFAIKLTDYGIAEVREGNVYKWEVAYAGGDVFRISIEGGVVKYYKNGTAFYSSARALSYPLIVEAAFIPLSGTIANAVIAATTGTLARSEDLAQGKHLLATRYVFLDPPQLRLTAAERTNRPFRGKACAANLAAVSCTLPVNTDSYWLASRLHIITVEQAYLGMWREATFSSPMLV